MIKIKILKERSKKYNPKELSIGVGEEYSEHDLSPEDAAKTAIDHLKKHSHYYTDLKKAGLDEQEDGIDSKKREIIAWKNSRWMFLDTETSGLPPDRKNPNRKDPRVVQIGYAIVDNMKVVKVFNKLVDPGEDVEIDPAAAAITGIDRAKLTASKAEKFISVIEEMKKDIQSCNVIMSYNTKFDRPVVEREFQIANVQIPQKSWLDPMIWVQKHLDLPDHKLKTVANYYKISLDNAHDAGADSKAAALVTMAFVQTFDGLPDDADEVVQLQGKWAKELAAARLAVWREKQSKLKVSWKKS